ncbi:olfactory receptor 51E1-like [Gastrophryne carolinensis]
MVRDLLGGTPRKKAREPVSSPSTGAIAALRRQEDHSPLDQEVELQKGHHPGEGQMKEEAATVIMLTLNNCHIPTTFVLAGLPGLESPYVWISMPFCFMFFTSLVGNSLILFVIIRNQHLHEPMFLFLCMLGSIDLLLSAVISPSVVRIFLFHHQSIRFQACLLQMFFIHSLAITESSVLVAMAFDRYVAICHPLRYTSILTHSTVAKIGLASFLRGTLLLVPPVTSLRFLPFCSDVLFHSYCLHQEVMKLACRGTNMFNIFYGLVVILCTVALDVFLIVLSYVLLIKSVLKATVKDRYKLLNTCVSHLCAVFFFYVLTVAMTVVHRFGKSISPLFLGIMANAYLFFPPVLNPIIYSIKSKHLRESLYEMFFKQQKD